MTTTAPHSKTGRNELCSCGSGKKFKRCCGAVDTASEDPASRFFGVAAVLVGLMLVAAVVVTAREMLASGPEQQAGKVWSEEHGHYHTVGGSGSGEGGPGKVWSEEHGHWHEAASGGEHVVLHADSPNAGALEGLHAAELEKAGERVVPPSE